MLRWVLIFFVATLGATVLGFDSLASVAQILFWVFLVLTLVMLVIRMARGFSTS